ncbi:hypothetical protein [Elizabethkingia anophelis]|uniref:hypothetical protein n=1 Tax=Elizabethkingia anophelis TaxID=1117645 RepID=UPI0009957575|nr:hypothetical protein [Elizabethkingia anophelis]AQW96682.1 hypothetical protein BBD31_01665 [Elizabethkingia anophelis]MDV3470865.1 hypothetical protein [Elizabethkingia anophelis]MDV3673677.1 hypothetical protein [Elizabethkingia anophelis]MDV3692401.1 hypothetical protein [Elizabethkingia anophelis]MDV3904948.1 hypothetical protein [Elizabethkingia anophelis]
MKNADKPIYPAVAEKINGTEFTEYNLPHNQLQLSGLTKREYFAGLAMQAIIPNWNLMKGVERGAVADIAVEMADSLLRQLENKK